MPLIRTQPSQYRTPTFSSRSLGPGRYLKADPGLPAAHGQIYRLPAGAFLEVDGGLITRVTMYYNLQDWLKQVGGVP